MKKNELTNIYIVDPQGNLQIINVPDGKHHYIGYIKYIKKQINIDSRLSSLASLTKMEVRPDLGVLISNKIYNKLTACNYFVLQTWYLPTEEMFYIKHNSIPKQEQQENAILKVFEMIDLKKEELLEEYHGSFIYKKPLSFSDNLTPDSVKRTR